MWGNATSQEDNLNGVKRDYRDVFGNPLEKLRCANASIRAMSSRRTGRCDAIFSPPAASFDECKAIVGTVMSPR
jgi:hypothetical protein